MINSILKKDKIITSLFYFMGLSSLVLADISILKFYPAKFVAEWAYLKSLLFIGGSILVFGLDQMFIRHSLKIKVYLPKFIIHVIFFSIIFAFVFHYNNINIKILIIILLFAINQLFFGAARANFYYQLSQTILQSWKIFFLLAILIAYLVSYKSNVYTLVILAFLISLLLYSRPLYRIINDGSVSSISMHLIYKDAFLMFISIITLNIAIYADQILIKKFATTYNIVKLFAHTSSIYPAGVAFNGLAGFFLGPYLKKRPKTSLRRVISIILPLAIILSLFSFVAGIFILRFIRHIKMDNFIGIVLSSVVFMRILYILPSSYIGVIGSQKMLKSFVYLCIIAVIFQVSIFLILVNFTSMNVTHAAVISVALHWFVRSIGGIVNIYLLKNIRPS